MASRLKKGGGLVKSAYKDKRKQCPKCGGKLVEIKKGLLVCCICKHEIQTK